MLKIREIYKSCKESEQGMYLLVGVIAVLVFVLIHGYQIINPCYTDWLMAGGDLSQHYLGWKAYRNSAWSFPIGMLDTLAYPSQTSIIFTDSIPLFAVFFKVFSNILPNEFQYFGIWGVTCFILQAMLSVKIVRRFSKSRVFAVLVGCMLSITPIMITRMYAHTALAGQWLILYGLDLFFNYSEYQNSSRKLYKRICLMGVLTASIHLYFLLMCGIVLAGLWVYQIIKEKAYKKAFIYSGSVVKTKI